MSVVLLRFRSYFLAVRLFSESKSLIDQPADSERIQITDRVEEAATKINWKEKRQAERFGHSMWRPKKRLTHYQIDYLRTLHRENPGEWPVSKLAKQFTISHSAVKRILKSKFEPSEEVKERQDRKAVENRQIRRKNVFKNFDQS